jgi:hypothetical protein
LGASWLVQSCSDHIELGRDFPIAAAGSIASAGSAASGGSGGNAGGGGAFGGGSGEAATHVCQKTTCQGQIYQCGDCFDNDGDHLVDSDDPDCTGPCDNTESSYYGGIPGQNNAPCREDCYFDANTGSGDDQCYWSQDCDLLSVAPGYPPSGDARCSYAPGATVPGSGSTCEGLAASQSNACLSFCLPITPNGCDCFGCCELPADSNKFVWIGSAQQNNGTCDAAHVDDPAACHPCTPVKSCFNSCDPCEVCVGRTVPSASCITPGSGRCLGAAAACGQPGEPDCPADQYCVTGCCEAAPR